MTSALSKGPGSAEAGLNQTAAGRLGPGRDLTFLLAGFELAARALDTTLTAGGPLLWWIRCPRECYCECGGVSFGTDSAGNRG